MTSTSGAESRRCCRHARSAISGGATIAESPVAFRCNPLSNSFFWNACPRLPVRHRVHVDRAEHAVAANVGTTNIAQREQTLEEIRRQRAAALEQPFALVDIECRQPRRARRRMPGVCVAVEKLDRALGAVLKIASWMRELIATAPIGCAPLVMPLAIVIRSGVTPKLCAANTGRCGRIR